MCIGTIIQYPKIPQFYGAPTYPLLRDIAYPTFELLLDEQEVPYTLNKSDKTLTIHGCAPIMFRTMEKPERIIGFEVGDFFLDEWDTLPKEKAMEVWRRCLSRARVKYPDGRWNRGRVATTPEGYRACYELFDKDVDEHFNIIRAPTYSNPHLPPTYLENLRSQYPPQLIDAYIEGKFVNLLFGTVYRSYSRKLNDSKETIRPSEPIYIGMDFNVGKMHAIVGVLRDGRPHVVSELTGIQDTPAMIFAIKERFYGHHITIYPDASSSARHTNDASQSDLRLLKEANFVVKANRKNPLIKDRVLAVNGMFCNSENDRALMINIQKCPVTTDAIESQSYDANGDPDKSSGYDHPCDALGYWIVKEWPIVRPNAMIAVAAGSY